jgi:hypothetical protein
VRKVDYKFKTNGDWIDAIAEPDELVINVGDMLSRHTNNKVYYSPSGKSTKRIMGNFKIFGTVFHAPSRHAIELFRKLY